MVNWRKVCSTVSVKLDQNVESEYRGNTINGCVIQISITSTIEIYEHEAHRGLKTEVNRE